MPDLTPETIAELREVYAAALPGDWYYGTPEDGTPEKATDWFTSCLHDPCSAATDLHMVWTPGLDGHTRVVAITGDGPRSRDHAALVWVMWRYFPDLLDDAAERDAVAADADKWQRAALTLQRDRDALTDERDSLSWQVEALRAERDARSSERDALAAKVERVRALPAKHPAGGWYMTSMRDVLAALDEEPQS